MADREDAQNFSPAVEVVNDPVTLYAEFQQAFELSLQGFAQRGIAGERPNRSLDCAFNIRWEVPDDFGYWRWNGRAVASHQRRALPTLCNGSPNTSSNERPF